jgi:hypothetical protein
VCPTACPPKIAERLCSGTVRQDGFGRRHTLGRHNVTASPQNGRQTFFKKSSPVGLSAPLVFYKSPSPSPPGLPDGIFSNKSPYFEDLAMEDDGIFHRPFVYLKSFMDIWYLLWTFGIFYGHLVSSMDIWYLLWTFGIHILL